jgi:hypothetical protein
MAKRKQKGSWVVRVKATVIKDVVVEGCTEDEARENPWEHAIEETEVEQTDWEVRSVEPNE